MTETEAKSVMVAARMRHTGLPRELVDLTDAGRPNAGTVHGILRLTGALTADQWSAAEWWLGTRAAYLRSILARGEPILASEGDGLDESAYAEWCAAQGDLWRRVKDCLLRTSVESRSPVEAALDVMLVRNRAVDHMVGDLRLGLNAIYREFLGGKCGVGGRMSCTDKRASRRMLQDDTSN